MKANLTELVFILDRSGSMRGMEKDVIGGFNSLIDKQKQEDGDANVTVVLFDDKYELLRSRESLKTITPLTNKEYYTRGSTALLDAVGKTITDIGQILSDTPEEERPEKVLFVITTDGQENSSRGYDYKRVKDMIEHQKEKYSWEFVFLAANIDAADVGERMGIDRQRTANYVSDSEGVSRCMSSVNNVVIQMRKGTLRRDDEAWKQDLKED